MEVASEESDCRFKVQREEQWIHTRPCRSVAVRERLLKLFCVQTSLILHYVLALDVIQVLDGS